MKYFLTGATGFIGGRVAKLLVDEGHEVVALVRDLSKSSHLADSGVTVVSGDIRDKESLRRPMDGVDGVFHIAAWYKVGARDTSDAASTNIEGTRNVLEMMESHGIRKGVYTSTLAVFSDTRGRLVDESYRYEGPHLSVYDRTKWEAHYGVAEPMIKRGLPLVIVQPGLVYGPGDTSAVGRTFKQYLLGKLPMLPEKTAFCWAHVDDVARGHLLAMQKGVPGDSYILAGPPHTFVEAFEIAERITGVRAPRLRGNPGLLKMMSALMRPLSFLPLPENYTSESLRVVAGVTYLGSNSKAKRELGYEVRALEDGLRETLLDRGQSPQFPNSQQIQA